MHDWKNFKARRAWHERIPPELFALLYVIVMGLVQTLDWHWLSN